MKKAFDIIKVVLTAAPTYLAVVVAAAPMVADEVAAVLPTPISERVAAVVLSFAAVAASVLAVIRRVEPVLRAHRGLLPVEPLGDIDIPAAFADALGGVAVRSSTSFPYNVAGERGRIEPGINIVPPEVYEVLAEGGMVEPI